MGMPVVPWQRYLLNQRDDVNDCFAKQRFIVRAMIRRAARKEAIMTL